MVGQADRRDLGGDDDEDLDEEDVDDETGGWSASWRALGMPRGLAQLLGPVMSMPGARCHGLTSLFYGERVADAQQAADVCTGHSELIPGPPCEYIDECRDAAIERREREGVWGGLVFTGRGPRDPAGMSSGSLLSLEVTKDRRAADKVAARATAVKVSRRTTRPPGPRGG